MYINIYIYINDKIDISPFLINFFEQIQSNKMKRINEKKSFSNF